MKTVDYIVVGSGLAGILFCEILNQNNKSFIVFDDNSQRSSTVAGGMYNPVTLKRFTSVWKAKEQLEIAIPFYHNIEQRLNVALDFKVPVYRMFASIEEQNNWHQACDNPVLTEFLSQEILTIVNKAINAKHGYGKVLQSGRIDTETLIQSFKKDLKSKNQLLEESFDHNNLTSTVEFVTYNSIHAKHIIFAEGFGLKKNPFFNTLPLNGTKGELLTIHAPDLKIDFVLKSSVFLIPLGEDHYRVGATYEWEDKTNSPTEKGKKELIKKLRSVINCEFTIVDHDAGIRPTVIDRKPLVGQHFEYKNLYVLNGLGTRGVMIAPYVAQQLFDYIEFGKKLEKEISISRFD